MAYRFVSVHALRSLTPHDCMAPIYVLFKKIYLRSLSESRYQSGCSSHKVQSVMKCRIYHRCICLLSFACVHDLHGQLPFIAYNGLLIAFTRSSSFFTSSQCFRFLFQPLPCALSALLAWFLPLLPFTLPFYMFLFVRSYCHGDKLVSERGWSDITR